MCDVHGSFYPVAASGKKELEKKKEKETTTAKDNKLYRKTAGKNNSM